MAIPEQAQTGEDTCSRRDDALWCGPMKLSVVIPVYNEVRTIEQIVHKVMNVDVGLDKELVLVDDASTDGSGDKLRKMRDQHPEWAFVFHDKSVAVFP